MGDYGPYFHFVLLIHWDVFRRETQKSRSPPTHSSSFKAFPGQGWYIIPSPNYGSAWGLLPVRFAQKSFMERQPVQSDAWTTSTEFFLCRGATALFRAPTASRSSSPSLYSKELYPSLPSRSTEEAHSSRLYPGSHFFHSTRLMRIRI